MIPSLDRAIDYATRYGISLQINLVIVLESFRSRTRTKAQHNAYFGFMQHTPTRRSPLSKP